MCLSPALALHNPRDEMDLPSCLSARNASFRRMVEQRQNQPLIIQKVPQSVRGGLDKRYFVPDVVSVGPYHHRSQHEPHLAEMEEVKEAVAFEFCCKHNALPVPADGEAAATVAARLLEEVKKILPDARGCYADASFDNIEGDNFAYMMVVDGCFVLAVMAVLTRRYPEGLEHGWWTRGRMPRIMKDILLFENQIPWIVLSKLMELLQPIPVDDFVDRILDNFDFDIHNHRRDGAQPPSRTGRVWEHLRPVHLLDLVHQRHLGKHDDGRSPTSRPIRYCDYARPFAQFTSVVELEEAGIHLHSSGTCRVADVRVDAELPATAKLCLCVGRLVLPKLSLSWLPRCWLINMVALECVTDRSDYSGVSSYLAILGSLVRSERDVEELRSSKILNSTMSDRRTVEFFDGLPDPLPRQDLYIQTLNDIVQLRTRRRTRSSIHTVYYRNRSIIFAAAPLLSLLVAIIGIVVTNSIKHTTSLLVN